MNTLGLAKPDRAVRSWAMATVVDAEGLAELGLWDDAWAVLEALPAADRATPQALRVRLACCPCLDAWEIGRHVANLLRDGGERDLEAAQSSSIQWRSNGFKKVTTMRLNWRSMRQFPHGRIIALL